MDLVRQNTVTSMGQTSNQLLNRFTRVQPDITIEEGSTAKIILTTSIMAKPYRVVFK
jgi:type IV secretory pathway VirB10-like protein